MNELVEQALARWGMARATVAFVAGRENQVYRVSGDRGDFALRIRRPGLRDRAELLSELHWLEAMKAAGLSVPRPEPSASGALIETIAGHHVDMVGWLSGQPMGKSRAPLALDDPRAVFRKLGQDMARLHDASDAFPLPQGFRRVSWDAQGLLGETPVWGRFWENPALDPETRDLLDSFRDRARQDLDALQGRLDFGLVHADLVRETVLIDGDDLRLIDFDDGGFGFRLFDIATALLKNRGEPGYPALKSALLEGYLSVRALDMDQLGLFMALRAATYVGWIVPRMGEDGGAIRNTGFIEDARQLCGTYLGRPI